MLSFISSERRAASVAFDEFVEATNRTLDNPAVMAQMGEVVTDFRRVTASAFLPNIRGGKFVIPRHQRGNDNLALVPLTAEQADNAYEVTAPLNTGSSVRSWSADVAASSARYGLDLPEELDALFHVGPPGAANAPTLKGLRPGTVARTEAQLGRTSDGTYWVSRPNLMVRSSLLEVGAFACGAAILHEAVHVSDLLEDGPLYGTLTYAGATELRAYHVSATIYRATNIDTPEGRDSVLLDSLREQEIGNTDKPFTPNSVLMDNMIRTGKV